jgi:hypothetical protein
LRQVRQHLVQGGAVKPAPAYRHTGNPSRIADVETRIGIEKNKVSALSNLNGSAISVHTEPG